MASESIQLQKLIADARQQPGKVVFLGGLVLLLGLLLMRNFGRSNPPAAALPMPASVVTASGNTLAIPAIRLEAQAIARWRNTPLPPLTRNLFEFNRDLPPVADIAQPSEEVAVPEPTRPGEFWQDMEQAMATDAALSSQDRSDRNLVLRDANRLRVTGLISGSKPIATLGGRPVRVGDSVPARAAVHDQFIVRAITEQGVIVERAGVRVLLRMNNEPNELLPALR